jgi:hypothetical protein
MNLSNTSVGSTPQFFYSFLIIFESAQASSESLRLLADTPYLLPFCLAMITAFFSTLTRSHISSWTAHPLIFFWINPHPIFSWLVPNHTSSWLAPNRASSCATRPHIFFYFKSKYSQALPLHIFFCSIRRFSSCSAPVLSEQPPAESANSMIQLFEDLEDPSISR